jgi:hypothetical protein
MPRAQQRREIQPNVERDQDPHTGDNRFSRSLTTYTGLLSPEVGPRNGHLPDVSRSRNSRPLVTPTSERGDVPPPCGLSGRRGRLAPDQGQRGPRFRFVQ